jgi:hypothetical protein
MKNITEYITEKLVLNKNTFKNNYDKDMSRFIQKHNISPKDAAYFNKYYKEDPKKFFGDYTAAGFDEFCASTLELLMMIAGCLIEDNMPAADFGELGYKHYRGKCNPYNFSWFDEEDSNGDTVLECIQKWIDNNYSEFLELYNTCKKYKITQDDAWDFYNHDEDE